MTLIANTEADLSTVENRFTSSTTSFTKYLTPNNSIIFIGISSYSDEKLYCVLGADQASRFLEGVDEFSNPVLMIVELLF